MSKPQIIVDIDTIENNLSTSTGDLNSHISNSLNPHSTTAAQVGLGNVTNESKSTMFTDPTFTGVVSLPETTNLNGSDLQTQINSKTSTGKAIAMAIVFGG